MKRLPPLTTPHEVLALRNELAEVAKGNRFLLQGGDCAELGVGSAEHSVGELGKLGGDVV